MARLHRAGPKAERLMMTDRRQHARLKIMRPVKLRLVGAARYVAGQLEDVSPGGALMRLEPGRAMPVGQAVQVGIAWGDDRTLLAADGLIDGRVVRHLSHDGVGMVAVRFDEAQTLAAAG